MSQHRLSPDSSKSTGWDARFATFLYRWRFLTALLALLAVAGAFATGAGRIADFTDSIARLGDTSNGSGAVQPLVFDPSMDVWFGAQDAAVETYYEIEDRFVAEDFVVVSFDVPDHEFGVFNRQSLATIDRLTHRFLTIPGVRHVRSLTYNPWIRWGEIEDGDASERGLIISDLVESDPTTLDDDALITRMVAVLGAQRVADRLGEARVRQVLGADADFANYIGEPLLLGTILDESGTTTAIQVQVLRPRVGEASLANAFGENAISPEAATAAGTLYSSQVQRKALRGIKHFLRLEAGLAVPTPEFEELQAWMESLPTGETKDAALLELKDPTRNFMIGEAGQRMRKFFEYDPSDTTYVDRSDPSSLAQAPADFTPQALSPFEFHLGGVPLFEKNFEDVGLADAFFIPLMFAVIAICLLLVFRHFAGVLVPFAVVLGSILAMVGTAFALGDLFNNLTITAPNMITAVGIADSVHLVAAWALLRTRHKNRRDLIIEVMRRNALPVLLTSITTAVGFYSLTVSELAPVYMLGYTAGLGTLIAYVLSMTLVPALLSLVPHDGRLKTRPSRLEKVFSAARSQAFVARVVRHRIAVVITASLVTLISLVGLTRVQIDTDFRGMFPRDNSTMRDFDWIETRLGGVGDLEIIFNGVVQGSDQEETQSTEEANSALDEGVGHGLSAGHSLSAGHNLSASHSLSAAEEESLSTLRLRRAGLREGIEGFEPLSVEESRQLTQLETAELAWKAARIGISPQFLGKLNEFETRLRQEMATPTSPLHVLTDLISPLDILRKMHQVQHENRAAFYRVPVEDDVPQELRQASLSFDEWSEEWSLVPAQDGASLVAQYYLQYENGARPGENLTTQLSADRTQLRMQGRVKQASSAEHRAAFRRIEELANEVFAEHPEADLTISGKTLLFARTTHLFAIGFVKSMSLALLLITLLIGLIFRSLRLALVSILPNVLPIILPLSVFGLFGWQLHGPAILVSSVALGVCVDDTIHFFTKYVRARRQGRGLEEALADVLKEVGAALTITTVVLMIGFATLLLSDFTPNFMMGALTTLMIGLAWVADFLLLPAVLSLTSRQQTFASSRSLNLDT